MAQPFRFEGTIGRTVAESEPWFAELAHPGEDAPSVMIVLLDDTGFAQLGCFGSDIATPNIDALAATFRILDTAERLSVPDVHLAADQFTWLTVGAPLNQMLLTDAAQPPASDGIPAAIELFLAKYHSQEGLLP